MAPAEFTEEDLRIFTRLMKEECWKKAPPVPGRDPERWRLDAAGNVVAYRLRGCEGCLCHEYDHIVPFSKGGRTEVANCQILQTRANRYKGNEENDTTKLVGYSCARTYSEAELDLVEIALYGGIKRPGNECRVFSIYELFEGYSGRKPPAKQRGLPHCQSPPLSSQDPKENGRGPPPGWFNTSSMGG